MRVGWLPADDRFRRVGEGGGLTLLAYVELSRATPFVRSADAVERDRFAHWGDHS